MDVQALAKLVSEMRAAQREFFRTKSNSALEESKRLERAVDKAIGDVLRPERQGSMF